MHPLISGTLTVYASYRAYSHKSLTPAGIFAALVTSIVHAVHPFSTLTVGLLFGFYFAANSATKHKHAVKQTLTVSSSGHAGGTTTRTHIQVLANSICASILILVHYFLSYDDIKSGKPVTFSLSKSSGWKDALIVGVMTQYAAVLSDTLSSELGILSKSHPRLIYNPTKVVPPGTNGGVSLTGFFFGTLGSIFIAGLSIVSTPFAENVSQEFKITLAGVIVGCGVLGTIVDSLLGATLQASVIDVLHGKIVESDGGEKVLVNSGIYPSIRGSVRGRAGIASEGVNATAKTKAVGGGEKKVAGSRKVYSGVDLLSNNGVNVVMAGLMAAVGVSWGLANVG
ncbi:hypothetical protein ABW19_dt0200713 [Dactylella cylindrospora]|nr:hypothetical protein ABW19_dt0200713 [Dactylella cylindrospora]